MNFKEQLADSSRIIGDMVAANVGCNPDYYNQILDLVLNESMPMSSRAGRVLNICTENCPALFQPHITRVIGFIKKRREIHRCILKIFAETPVDLTTNQEGILIDACFSWLADEKQSVAVKAYCMDILERFVLKEPEIIPELLSLLEEIHSMGSPGIKNKAAKIIKKLSGKRIRYF